MIEQKEYIASKKRIHVIKLSWYHKYVSVFDKKSISI